MFPISWSIELELEYGMLKFLSPTPTFHSNFFLLKKFLDLGAGWGGWRAAGEPAALYR